MRRTVAIFGTLMIAAVLIISGSAVATWVYVTVYDSYNCTNILKIENAADNDHATLGRNPTTFGNVILDLGLTNVMGPSQDFTVFASFGYEDEDYKVWVSETLPTVEYLGENDDQGNHIFTTPSTFGKTWRYIILEGITGSTSMDDPTWGPEIDAVGWDK